MQLKDHLYQVIQSLPDFFVEIWLAVAFLALILAELVLKNSRWQHRTCGILSALTFGFGLIALGLVFLQWNAPEGYLFHHLLYLDHKAVFFKVPVLLTTLTVLIHVRVTRSDLPPEFYSILMAVVLGLCLMTMAVNGLSIYLSIELVSVGSYLLATLGNHKKAGEGGLKYLLFGALSSAIMLYGLSLIYGITGTLDITSPDFVAQFAINPTPVLAIVGFLSMGGILFKLSLVPFHVWAPDIYEAAPVPVAAFLSTAPKAAALLILMRFLSALPVDLQRLTALLALSGLLIGNLSALWQNNLQRLLAYSGIAQAGFILVGLVAFNQAGFESAVFYIVVYVLMNLAAFLLVDLLHEATPTFEALAGKGATHPFLSVCFTVVMAGLVGLPPTVGFMAKLFVFSALWESYQTIGDQLLAALLFIGLLNAVVSLFYYFKVPFYLFFRQNTSLSVATGVSFSAKILVAVLTAGIIFLFLKADWLMDRIKVLL